MIGGATWSPSARFRPSSSLEATEGIWHKPWPVQLNRLVWEGRHDLILSIGQVVPHEVIGMANHNKNLFVGVGGSQGINESHFIAALYGMERIMGRADTPVRRILNYAQAHFCPHLPVVFVLTVIGPRSPQSGADIPVCQSDPAHRQTRMSAPPDERAALRCEACSLATTATVSSRRRLCRSRSTSRSWKNRRGRSSSGSIPRSSTARGLATSRSTARGWPWPTAAS